MDMEHIFREMEKAEFGYHEYDGMTMNTVFPAKILDKIKETAFREEDIIVATYPKCGTTWMLEIIDLILNEMQPSTIPTYARHPFIESQFPGLPADFDKWVSSNEGQVIKTHLGPKFYQKTLDGRKTKFIVVLRNPKDALVSYYHFYKANKVFKFNGTWNDFFQLYKKKKISHGDCLEAQLSWWKLRDVPRILIVKYEDMLKSPSATIRQVGTHLGKSLSDDVVRKIVEMTSFESMKVNPLVNYTGIPLMRTEEIPFMRKGTVGDWKNFFSPEQAHYVDNQSDKYLKPEGLHFQDQ